MRNLKINERKIYVLNYKNKVDVVDGDGNYSGEITVVYEPRKCFKAHVSGAKGSSQSEIFGTDVRYDKTFVITKEKFELLQITENSVFFVDIQPVYDANHNPLYDYRVERIAETINEVAVAITKVRRN